MSLNYLLIWIACLGGVFTFLRTRQRREDELVFIFRWAVLTLLVLGGSLLFIPEYAGYLGAIPWLLGVVFPQVAIGRIISRYERSDGLLRSSPWIWWVRLIPGARKWANRYQTLLTAEGRIAAGEIKEAVRLLGKIVRTGSLAALYARARMLALLGGWGELYMLSQQFALSQSGRSSLFFSEMAVSALAHMGKSEEAIVLIEGLKNTFPVGSRERERLLHAIPSLEQPKVEALLTENATHPVAPNTPRVVSALGIVLCIAYLLSLRGNFDQNIERFAFDPFQILLFHEWWRIGSCAFLHANLLHLGSNVLGLFILGPFLAKQIGSLRFGLLFCLSVIGASLMILGLTWFSLISPRLMIGASGGVMGIVGGYIAFYLQGYLRSGSIYHKEQLRGVLMIVVLQTLFDITTPEVSFVAHFGGLFSGMLSFYFLLGWKGNSVYR